MRRQRERPRLEIEPAGLDLGEVQNLFDQRQQRIAGGLHRAGIGNLFGRKPGIEQKVRHAENAVQGRSNFVRYHRKEARLGAVGGFRLVARFGERAFRHDAIGNIAAHGLDFGLAALATHDALAPGDPALAGRSGDLLVVDAPAIGEDCRIALFENLEGEIGAAQEARVAAGKRAIGVVGKGDCAVAAPPHDQIGLRFQECARTLLGLLQLPELIGQLLAALFHAARAAAPDPVAGDEKRHEGTGEGEQRRDADREQHRIVFRIAGGRAGDQTDADPHPDHQQKGHACERNDQSAHAPPRCVKKPHA